MKVINLNTSTAENHTARVNNFLLRGFIYLTSEKFSIFASGFGALLAYFGAIIDNPHTIAYGGLSFLAGFFPWAIRRTARDLRQQKLGLKKS